MDFTDKSKINHEKFGEGLRVSLYNFMHETGFDLPLQDWFNFKISKTSIHTDYIYNSINQNFENKIKSNARILWMGYPVKIEQFTSNKKGKTRQKSQLLVYTKTETIKIPMDHTISEWLTVQLNQSSIANSNIRTLEKFKTDYESQYGNFEVFWESKEITTLRNNGLLLV